MVTELHPHPNMRAQVMLLGGDAIPKQQQAVRELKAQMDRYLEVYERHCSDEHFRKGVCVCVCVGAVWCC